MKYSIIAIALAFLLAGALSAESKWQKVTDKNKSKVLKEFNFEKTLKTLKEKAEFGKENSVPYSMCDEKFPEMPGQFPCSFLTDEYSESSGEDVKNDSSAGGKTGLKISKKNSSLGGKVMILGEDEEDGKVNEDLLKLYFKSDKYISHYQYKNTVVLFKWTGKKGEETLISILQLKLGKSEKPQDLKRIQFK